MPTYQYACTGCGERLEVAQKFTEDPLTECPSCAGRLRKVFSAVGVVFKGSGFYRTDSRSSSGGGSKSTESSSTESSSTESSSSAGSDSGSSTSSGNEGGATSGSSKPAQTTSSGAKGSAASGSSTSSAA